MANPTIRFKRGTQSAFSAVGLNTGEPAFITDESNFYIGVDGNSANNKFFGSSRYWKKETTTAGGGVNLVGSHAVGVGGTAITLAAPAAVGTAITYTFPSTITAGYQLVTDANGNLSWSNATPSGGFSGVVTFTDVTNNTLGDENTGSVQLDGGMGIAKNLTVKENLYVGGYSEFVGVVTFKGGTINLGDANTDDINVAGEFVSNLVPNTDATYDLGSSQRWRNANLSGVVTATTFVGNLTGTATTATSVSTDSVGLGTHTYGDYVKNITGTSNQITVTSGTGEGSTPTLSLPNTLTAPQDVEVTRDLQVNRNLNVNGNITIGGTAATLFTTEFKVYDPDIVLGFRTDANNNDVSTDTTANHGGIAIASTEGNPLVNLFIAGIETTPATYKKIMWFKSGEFAGLGTDAWLMNYAVGIGSTQFPVGTRLAAGNVQFTQNDLAVVRNINASGIITATSFSGNATSATYASVAGVATYATSAGVATYATNSGISTQVKTVTASDTNATYHLTFVDSHNGSATAETVYTDDGIYYNPGTNTFTTQYGYFTGNVTVDGTITGTASTATRATTVDTTGTSNNATYYVTFVDTSGGQTGETLRVGTALTINASTGNVKSSGDLITGSGYLSSPNGTRAMYLYDTSGDVSFQGKVVANNYRSSSNSNNTLTFVDLDATFARNLYITGITTVASDLVVTGDVRINGNDIRSSTGNSAITLNDQSVTINGDLYVSGSTTQVNTTTLTVEDNLLELSKVDGNTPVSDINKDVGLLLHYYDTSARLGAVYWDDSTSRIVLASRVTESSGVLTVDSGYYADVELKGLYVTDTAGTANPVISYTTIGGVTGRHLQDIIVDGGTF